ncbi:MAG: arylsulfotransferase family protein, partial [Planctomycetota bacterium]
EVAWRLERALVPQTRGRRTVRLGPRSEGDAAALLERVEPDLAIVNADPTSEADRWVLEAVEARGREVFRSPSEPRWAFGMGYQSRKRSALGVGLFAERPGPALVVYDLRAPDDDRAARERAALEALGYAAEGARVEGEEAGIVQRDPSRMAAGFDLILSAHAPEAVVLDPRGRAVHRWTLDFPSIWPERDYSPKDTRFNSWRRVRPLDDGRLLAIFEGLGLVCLERDSSLAWSYEARAHHDLDLLDDGTILCLARAVREVPDLHPSIAILDDQVVTLDSEGRVRTSVSLLDAIDASPFAAELRAEIRGALERSDRQGRTDLLAGDVFHTNTLTVLDSRNASALPGARPGDLLLCVRNLNRVVALDLAAATLTACVRGPWKRPHEATALPSGRILIFDNQGGAGGRSRVFEYDARSGERGWAYGDRPGESLASRVLGSVQRLANGNTLITDSNRGRALEVTDDGELVWEYVNPHRAPGAEERVARLFEALRLPQQAFGAWLESSER